MIANCSRAAGKKVNCFISVREMLSIILHCAFVLAVYFKLVACYILSYSELIQFRKIQDVSFPVLSNVYNFKILSVEFHNLASEDG